MNIVNNYWYISTSFYIPDFAMRTKPFPYGNIHTMKTYLVGGAVRDQLLGFPYHEKDWVVVGGTPEQMLTAGYQQVGKDFPVFLHPTTHEEYALARTERKTAPGYHGFQIHASPDITLEQDLQRRDLTINAIAEDKNGRIIDPCHGVDDIKNKCLRHISPAFAEDPVRILRVARFAARYAHLGFTVADETLQLMQKMVHQGEVDALVAERVWQEMRRALGEKTPTVFIEVLRRCGALARIIPELDCLFGVPQPVEHHPEVDAGIHTLLVLEQACHLSEDTDVRLAALFHDLGKGSTPKDQWPAHINHEARGADIVLQVCQRLRIPHNYRDLAERTARFHLHFHRALELRATTVVKTLQQLDAWRKPQRYEKFLLAAEADARGRPGYENQKLPQRDFLRAALNTTRDIDIQALIQQGYEKLALAHKIYDIRVSRIKTLQQQYTPEQAGVNRNS